VTHESARPDVRDRRRQLGRAKAAETLREERFDGRVVLIGTEPARPYERPPLTKDYLRSESTREQTYVHPESFYAEHDIELISGTVVTALDPGRSLLMLDDGHELGYDRLLLATGAEPRRLPLPGADLDGIYYLRTLAACDALRRRLKAGGKGGGDRCRLDRSGVRRLGAPARRRGDGHRAGRGAARARDRR
jgi:3-phenylpropionate/trans-cinnamate dioxygenase ferredoxin reductase component